MAPQSSTGKSGKGGKGKTVASGERKAPESRSSRAGLVFRKPFSRVGLINTQLMLHDRCTTAVGRIDRKLRAFQPRIGAGAPGELASPL